MGTMTDYDDYDAMELAALVREGKTTPDELLDTAVERMEQVDPHINAVVLRHVDEARAAIADGLPDGPFTGVPFLLKNLHVALEGTITDSGSAFFADMVATQDTTLVARYKKAGFVIFGKTNSPEFGLTTSTEPRLHGATRNPWDLNRSAGGSSGGAAAAVAGGILPAAQASDGGGSIRIPAAACGLVGFKPTRARTPAGPVKGEGWAGMSHMHVVSRSVRDSAAILDATAGPEEGDPYAAPPGGPFLDSLTREPVRLRIALVLDEPEGVVIAPECRAAVECTAALLTDLGHHVEPASLPFEDYEVRLAQSAVISGSIAGLIKERAEALGREPGSDDLEAVTHRTVATGRTLTAEDYALGTQIMHKIGRAMGRFHQTYDIVLQPTLATPPPPIGKIHLGREDTAQYFADLYAFAPFLAPYNATGAPSVSLPLHWTGDNFPIGVMLSAAFGADDLLFSLSGQLERARPWDRRRPRLPA